MAKCFKCGKPHFDYWRICSDNLRWHPVCREHDLELNKIALRWAFPRVWKQKYDAYVREQKTRQPRKK